MASLPQYDDHFDKLNVTANNNQQVLRYVGVIDPIGNKSEVKLVRYV
jgi:homoserine dehydrogenase